ncbi:hypothetical protein OK351_14205 [Glutamicibacter sp. MNS18]|uniref:hypothetical protein n=1 Tax=Glutamicibacter sp. MNS18 TaxID=2989817 RepID=UPI002236B699|nr:hypothetical protein [Glutamicibacter sp. MNS18]MCW4466644.1 hypothetical protein [Glutamicibacter sp. MNS18]
MAKKKCGFTKFLIVGLIAAAVAALVAAWKASNPIDDPWTLPTPKATTHDPVGEAKTASVDEIRDLASEK